MPGDPIREFWERGPCGTADVSGTPLSPAWFAAVEERRYRVEPFVRDIARFEDAVGRRVLEIGVGAGSDHLQFARSGAHLSGVDLTEVAIDTTRAHLALYGLTSDLRRVDAEQLPFDDASFDIVYSWGVIHHAHNPSAVIDEVRRVLRPGGSFIGMFYNRNSVLAWRMWTKRSLLGLRPWRSRASVIAANVESPGTHAYTLRELAAMFSDFDSCEMETVVTPYDRERIPGVLARRIPRRMGWFIAVRAAA